MSVLPSRQVFRELIRSGRYVPVGVCLPLEADARSIFEAADFAAPAALLESARLHPVTGRYSLIAGEPALSLTAHGREVQITTDDGVRTIETDPFETVQQLLDEKRALRVPGLPPFAGGAIGTIGFDACRLLEQLPSRAADDLHLPDLAFLFCDEGIVLDHLEGKLWAVALAVPGSSPDRSYDEAIARAEDLLKRATGSGPASTRTKLDSRFHGNDSTLSSTHSRASFEAMVRRAKEFISDGEIYQANLSQRFSAPFREDPWALYRRLTEINPSPFAAFVDFGPLQIVSASPERFLRVSGDRLETRPIAGTRPRGQTPAEEARLRQELLLNEKERAEHLMLVDLERNDLGRVCRYGSVEVDDLMALEEYSHVIHIVSNVRGELNPGVGLKELMTATFPGGTITGCPKIRCLEIIDALEPVRRQLYTGSLGYLSYTGDLDMNLLIRTAVVREGKVYVQAGAGIVADSDPSREYDETLHKAQALLEAIGATTPDVILTLSAAKGKDPVLETRAFISSGVSG